MTTKTLLYDLINIDTELKEAGFAEGHVIGGGSLVGDNRPPSPFIVIRWGTEGRGMGSMTRRIVTIWVHDEPGSYETIDSALDRLKAILDGVAHVSDGEGNWLSSIEWESNSGELYDPGYRTITKNSTYTIIGTGV